MDVHHFKKNWKLISTCFNSVFNRILSYRFGAKSSFGGIFETLFEAHTYKFSKFLKWCIFNPWPAQALADIYICGSCVLILILKSNSAFVLIYLTLWFCLYFFLKTNTDFTPIPFRRVDNVSSIKKISFPIWICP